MSTKYYGELSEQQLEKITGGDANFKEGKYIFSCPFCGTDFKLTVYADKMTLDNDTPFGACPCGATMEVKNSSHITFRKDGKEDSQKVTSYE